MSEKKNKNLYSYQKKYQKSDKGKAYKRNYYLSNIDKIKNYYQKNKEVRNEYSKKYYEDHKEEIQKKRKEERIKIIETEKRILDIIANPFKIDDQSNNSLSDETKGE